MASSPKVARGREWELSPRGREVKRLLEGKRPAQQLFDKKAPTVEQGQSWRSDLGIQDICSEMVTHKQRARKNKGQRSRILTAKLPYTHGRATTVLRECQARARARANRRELATSQRVT